MGKRRWQVQLTLMPGSETWVRVEHAWGHFKLPADAPIHEMLRGIDGRWNGAVDAAPASTLMRVPWDRLKALEAIERDWKRMVSQG